MMGAMDIAEFVRARLDEDELWAKAASAGRRPEDGTVEGGIHWTWAVGDNWDPVVADPLEPYMGGHGGEWSSPVVLRSVEEWQLSYGGPGNTLPVKIAEAEELRTADGAHIVRHDPARVLREVEAKRRLLAACAEYDDCPAGMSGSGLAYHVEELLALPYADHPDYRDEWRP